MGGNDPLPQPYMSDQRLDRLRVNQNGDVLSRVCKTLLDILQLRCEN